MVNWRDWHSSCQETQLTPAWKHWDITDKVSYVDLHCWARTAVSPPGVLPGTRGLHCIGYIALPGLSVQNQFKFFLLLSWMLVHDNVIPLTVTWRESHRRPGINKLRKSDTQDSVTFCPHQGVMWTQHYRGSNSTWGRGKKLCIWNVLDCSSFFRRIHLIDMGSEQSKKCLKCLSQGLHYGNACPSQRCWERSWAVSLSLPGSIRARDDHSGKKKRSSH